MAGYEFQGPEKFARRVAEGARRPELADDLAGDPLVLRVAEAIGRLRDAQGDQERHHAHQEVIDCFDRASMVRETCAAMVAEALPPFGFRRPGDLADRKYAARPQAPPEDPEDPYKHEQLLDESGNPVTLDPNNPEHDQWIKRAPQYGTVPSDHLARRAAGDRMGRKSTLAEHALRGTPMYAGDLLRGPEMQATGNAPGGVPIDASQIDREFDAWMKSPEGRRQIQQSRAAAAGADVSPSGAGTTSKPNTGVNQDINTQGFQVADEQPPQAVDPFQGHRAGHMEPPAQREAQAPVTLAGQQPQGTPAQQAVAEGGEPGKSKRGK